MMNLMHWRMLVAVADTGNITRAAERIGMTQSGASQALALLEDMLGVQLFTRENRQTLPTAIGMQVVEQARVMLEALQTIRSTVDAAKDVQRGTLRLASFPMVLAKFLPPLLRRFNRLYPGIEVVALEVSDHEVEALLEAGLVDLGVVLNPPPERTCAVLGRDSWVGVAPLGHPLVRQAREGSVTLAELIEYPFVLATGGCTVNARSLAAEAGLVLRDVRVEVREWSSAFTLVQDNVGVTLVPEMTLPVNRRRLSVFPLATPLHREFGLVASSREASSPAVQVLLGMLTQEVPLTTV